MHEIPRQEMAELARHVDDPFLRHHVDPALSERAWVAGRAAVVDTSSGRPGGQRPAFACVGPVEDLAPLMAAVAEAGALPRRISVDREAAEAVPAAWAYADRWAWDWMLTTSSPPPAVEARTATEVVDLDEDDPADRAAVEAVIDAANPGSFARPGVRGLETWLGVRTAAGLAGVGALLRMPDGTGHLRAISVLEEHRGLGLGGVLSAALTRRGLVAAPPDRPAKGPGGANGVVTLGVYTDNLPALAVYRRLGYRTRHTFVSGPTVAGAAHDAA